MQYTHHYTSPLGGITLLSDGEALTGLLFDGQKYFDETMRKPHESRDLPIFEETANWLDTYFSGKAPNFTPKLALSGTPFRHMVWGRLLSIPFGTTLTYGQLADDIARTLGRETMSPQAIGGAVGHNPISLIVPCHRILGADGSLTGYAGGIERKRALLKLEGIL